ncbi:MAG: acyl-CoA dehydrogenase [Candidatus Binatota bacterium]|nr:acyl-CoA dehydrogenase [Candidatus Binatota bacterium]
MAWDFSTEPEFQQKLDWIHGFMRAEVFPLETLDLTQRELDRVTAPMKQEVKRQRLWAAHLDPELGGQGYGQVKLGLMHELIGQSKLGPQVFGNQAPDSGNSEILAKHATPPQREKYLAPLLDGSKRSCFAMTEPGAGADPTLLETRAVRDGDVWVLNGDKWFATNASVADFFIVMTVTNIEAAPHARASMFLIDAGTPGFDVVRDLGSMEDPHPRPGGFDTHSEVRLRDVRVPADNVLGELGAGFAMAQERLGPGRIHHCMRWIGQAKRAFDMLCERSLYRRAFGSLLCEKQTIQNWIADSAADIHAARLMTLQAAWKMEREGTRAARKEIAMIKYWGARVLHDAIDRALQIHGSLGYSSDLPLEEMYRRARAARIYDGPDEVHRQTVARLILREYSPPADGIPTEHVPTRRERARRRFAELLDRETANL